MNAANSAGDFHSTAQPIRDSFSRNAGCCTIVSIARAIRATIGSGSVGRPDQAEPGLHPDVRQADLSRGRHIGEHRMPARAGLRQDAQLAALGDARAASPIDTISIWPEIASVAACAPPR